MLFDRVAPEHTSPFLRYLATQFQDGDRLPSLAVISQELGVSLAALREQLEVARALGLVEVRPRTGIRRLPYSFHPAVMHSLGYATTVNDKSFLLFAELRTNLEAAYWYQAVRLLTGEDQEYLSDLVARAEEKLSRVPAEIPHGEHRELHLSIYRRLNNPFVNGILETYWELYEAVGLAMINEFAYLKNVWQYHRKMVDAICRGDLDQGYQALVEHADLLQKRPQQVVRQKFE